MVCCRTCTLEALGNKEDTQRLPPHAASSIWSVSGPRQTAHSMHLGTQYQHSLHSRSFLPSRFFNNETTLMLVLVSKPFLCLWQNLHSTYTWFSWARRNHPHLVAFGTHLEVDCSLLRKVSQKCWEMVFSEARDAIDVKCLQLMIVLRQTFTTCNDSFWN